MKSLRSTLIPLALASGILAIGADCVSFRRGDANDDGRIDMSDAIFTLNYLFLGGEAPPCLDAADSNDDGIVDISDPIYILNFLFLGGPESPSSGGECSFDPSPDLLTCGSFGSCSPCKVPASENAAPFVTILSPADGEEVGSETSVTVEFFRMTDTDDGHRTGWVTMIELIAGGQIIATLNRPPRSNRGRHTFRRVNLSSVASAGERVCLAARVYKAVEMARLCRNSTPVRVTLVEEEGERARNTGRRLRK